MTQAKPETAMDVPWGEQGCVANGDQAQQQQIQDAGPTGVLSQHPRDSSRDKVVP